MLIMRLVGIGILIAIDDDISVCILIYNREYHVSNSTCPIIMSVRGMNG